MHNHSYTLCFFTEKFSSKMKVSTLYQIFHFINIFAKVWIKSHLCLTLQKICNLFIASFTFLCFVFITEKYKSPNFFEDRAVSK